MSESKPNVPKLRFPGFTDPWEQRKLGEVAAISRGERFTADDYVSGAGIPCIHYGEIYTSYGTIADSTISQVRKELGSTLRYAEPGDIIMACTSENVEDVCKSVVWLGKSLVAYHDDSAAISFDGDPIFLASFFQSHRFFAQKAAIAHGVKVMRVSLDALAGVYIPMPSLPEQRAIGALFRDVDNLITLHQRELDDVKHLKRGLLQKMFPKEGADVPELRFPGFTDPWEQRKADSVFAFRNERNRSDLPVLSATQEFGMVFRDGAVRAVGHNVKNEITYKRVAPGDFVIHLRSFQGGFAHSPMEGIVSPAYSVLSFIDQDEQDDMFWKYLFASDRFIRSLIRITYGIRDGRSISAEEFMNEPLCFPAASEQRAIGTLFRDVDDLITLHQRELDHVKLLKKALLQQMFV